MNTRKMNRFTSLFLALLAAALILPVSGIAQTTTAGIIGAVTDPSGAVVPGATISVKNLSTGGARTQKSDASGAFAFTLLPIGAYTVTGEAAGFKTYVAPYITLALGDRLRLNIALEVGSAQQTIEVSAHGPILQTDTSSTGTLIPTTSVEDLPLNGRNFVTLVQLAAGAADSSVGFSGGNETAGGDDRRSTSQLQVNGQYTWENNYMIDGTDNNERFIGTVLVKPAISSIQEMRVITSNYSADFGRTAGAVINMITRSGTNGLHGSGYEYFRNQVMDARNFFATTGPKPAYRQNQVGGSMGGAIRRDKMFFFVDYEALRLGQAGTAIQTVPIANGVAPIQTNAAIAAAAGPYTGNPNTGPRTGNFSGIAKIYDPASCPPGSAAANCIRTQFPGNVIPTSRVDSASVALMNVLPLPNHGTPGQLTANYISSPVTSNDEDTMDVRFDNQFNSSNTAHVRYTYANIRFNQQGSMPPLTNGTYTDQSTHGLSSDYVHPVTPQLIMELQFGWARFLVASLPGSYGQNLSQRLLGMANINVSPATSQISRFMVSDGSLATLGDQTYVPEYNTEGNWEEAGSVVWQRGPHIFKFGAVNRFRTDTQDQQGQPAGQFVFTPLLAQGNTNTGVNVANTGIATAALMLGYPNQVNRIIQLSVPDYRFKEASAYAMDDWRARTWLTLNFGLRYDYYSPTYAANNQISNFNYNTNKIQSAGEGGWGSNAGVTMGKLNLSPRIGFAATLGKNLVARGGYAMTYIPYFLGTQGAMRNPPFTSQYTIATGQFFPQFSLTNKNPSGGANSPWTTNIPTMQMPKPDDPNNPYGQIYSVRPHLMIPYFHQINLTVQRQFGATSGSIGYVGLLGRQQSWANAGIDVNAPTPGSTASNQQRRPFNTLYPNMQQLWMWGNTGISGYSGLQASVERRLTNGFEAFANYTWSHNLDNFEYQPLDNSNILNNPFSGYRTTAGNSQIDLRHRFTMALSYRLQSHLSGWSGRALNDWGFNAIFQTQSGQSYNVANSTDVAGTNSEGGNRPNVVGDWTKGGAIGSQTGCPVNVHNSHAYTGTGGIQWHNPCAFVAQTQGTYGNLARSQLYGPHATSLDFAANRTFRLTEKLRLELRGELFNALNHPNFGMPATGMGGNAGQINSTASGAFGLPRNVQLAGTFKF